MMATLIFYTLKPATGWFVAFKLALFVAYSFENQWIEKVKPYVEASCKFWPPRELCKKPPKRPE